MVDMSESEQMNTDRYVLEIESDTVKVIEAESGDLVWSYTGSDRLINATQHVEALNADPAPLTPLAEDTDRYGLEIDGDTVKIVDTQPGIHARRWWNFTGPDRLLAATEKLELLQVQAEQDDEDRAEAFEMAPVPSLADGGVPTWQETSDFTPAAGTEAQLRESAPQLFLAGLPAYARQQRLNAMLGEVSEIEARYVALLADDARLLARASELRVRLQKALVRPLSSTLPVQNVPEVPEEGPRFPSLQRAAQELVRLEEDGKWYVPPLAGLKPLPY